MRFMDMFKCNKADYCILVNKEHPLSNELDCFVFEIARNIYGGICFVEKNTLHCFLELFETLKKQYGIEIGIDSSYRSFQEQKKLQIEFEQKYGIEYAKQYVAKPGESEHHTGLAIDISIKVTNEWVVDNEILFRMKREFAIIHSLLDSYGFILRYPLSKERITGYSYEPWHIRFVGNDEAKSITKRGLTLEEYIEE